MNATSHSFDPRCLRLYLITDRSAAGGVDLCDAVAQAIAGGVTIVQLREKHLPRMALLALAARLHAVTRSFGVPLIINDHPDIMLEIGAEGVHVGANDVDIATARKLAGGRIVGATAKSKAQIQAAFVAGADYVGVGPVFASATKPDAGRVLGVAGLCDLVAEAPLPCVAIGGIEAANAMLLAPAPIAGICTVRGILGQPDVTEAARTMRAAFARRPNASRQGNATSQCRTRT